MTGELKQLYSETHSFLLLNERVNLRLWYHCFVMVIVKLWIQHDDFTAGWRKTRCWTVRKMIYLNVSLDKRPKVNKNYALYIMEFLSKCDVLETILYENLSLCPLGPYFILGLLIHRNIRIRIRRKGDWLLLLRSSKLFLFLFFSSLHLHQMIW